MKNPTPSRIFWLAILVAVLLVVLILGSVLLTLINPWTWIMNVGIAALILTVGYILGKKSENEDKK